MLDRDLDPDDRAYHVDDALTPDEAHEMATDELMCDGLAIANALCSLCHDGGKPADVAEITADQLWEPAAQPTHALLAVLFSGLQRDVPRALGVLRERVKAELAELIEERADALLRDAAGDDEDAAARRAEDAERDREESRRMA